jgi:hypothetical protein
MVERPKVAIRDGGLRTAANVANSALYGDRAALKNATGHLNAAAITVVYALRDPIQESSGLDLLPDETEGLSPDAVDAI